MAEFPFQSCDRELVESVYGQFSPGAGVCIDSRSVCPGAIFFGIPGQRVDGASFAAEALAAGAALAVVGHASTGLPSDPRIVRTPDPALLLQALAAHHRGQLSIPVLAVTGSNGKTTTRSLIQAALATRYLVGGTSGNHNNELGLPLSILNAPRDAQLLVLEMGASKPGDIALLCALARPTHGLITNVGEAHLEGFGSLEGVAAAKGELFAHLAASGGTGFVNADDPLVAPQAERVHLGCSASPYSQGMYQAAASQGDDGQLGAQLAWAGQSYSLRTQLVGGYNLANLVAALHVALHFNIEAQRAVEAFASYQPVGHRSRLIAGARGNRIIADCYNANPSSMRLAVDNLLALAGDAPKLLILGAMNELGEDSPRAHGELLDSLRGLENARMIYIGEQWNAARRPGFWFHTTEHARAFIANELPSDSWILVKGSRAYGLEALVELLTGGE
ncbi:MAG: hypothetical protein CSA07_00320 [Bacteroidia bacterium]|nr:MAG: hypothetical protein CSA07_00320 [Bacteroidia bacterium]